MANLKDLIVNGSARILGTIFGNLVGNVTGNCTGNATTATTLQNTRTINGTNFNGSANITTTNWGTARNISISDSDGTNTGTAVSVNGSGNATLKLPATIKASITGNCSGSSGSCTGNANTATTATTATKIKVNDHSANNATYYPLWATGAGNSMDVYSTTSKLKFNPSTGVLTSTSFAGNVTGGTGSFTSNAFGTALSVTRTENTGGAMAIKFINGTANKGYLGLNAGGIPAYWNSSSTEQYLVRQGTANTAVGSASQPVYIANDGTATACTMTTIQAPTLFEYVSGSTTNWRRVWSNGWKEEGGYVTKSSNAQSVSFLNGSNSTPGFTNPPTVILTPYYTGESDSRPVYLKSVTKSAFIIYIYSSLTGFYYYACGY